MFAIVLQFWPGSRFFFLVFFVLALEISSRRGLMIGNFATCC